MTVVIDTAAVLAFIFGEPGGERAGGRFSGALMSSVNLTETVSKMVDYGADYDEALSDVVSLKLKIAEFDITQSLLAAQLRDRTRHRGLSLGDRACLALAIREDATAVTADRQWADLDVGCKIEIIR